MGAGSAGNFPNTANVSRNPIYNHPNNQTASPGANINLLNDRQIHGGGQHYRGHQVERPPNKSGIGQGFYRPPRQQHGGLHSHHSQYDNFGKDQGKPKF